jgi:hypothetical protein
MLQDLDRVKEEIRKGNVRRSYVQLSGWMGCVDPCDTAQTGRQC